MPMSRILIAWWMLLADRNPGGGIELNTLAARIGRMAKRRRGRPDDRHASPFMVRLPEVYRAQLRRLQEAIRARHRFRPPMTALIQQALEDLLAQHDLWP